MTRVHLLSDPDVAFNAFAFQYPLLRHRQAIERRGFDLRIFQSPEEGMADCDVLILEGQHVTLSSAWRRDPEDVLSRIDEWRQIAGEVLWVDTTASTWTPHARALPHVDRFYKGQILADRDRYGERFYGGRIFSDHYHREYGVEDDDGFYADSIPADQRSKLGVAWNSALANYSMFRPVVSRVYRALHWPGVLVMPIRWGTPSTDRSVDVSARFGAGKALASVGFQRQRMLERLPEHVPTNRLSRWRYFRELRDAKMTLSPFGWGEKCYRDYEALLSGSLLVKPDVSHMETWPAIYREDAMVSLDWDLEELPEILEKIAADYEEYLPRAETAQQIYRRHLVGPEAEELFIERFEDVLAGRI